MKTIRYTLLVLLACLSLNSCQDVEDPANTVPTVVTDAVEKYLGDFAYLSGTVSSRAECYFLISTSEDMSDAQKVEVYPYQNEEKGNWTCFRELGDLIPGTTYYVVLCATDGRSEVKGNVVSFTTNKNIRIANISVTPCGNSESEEKTDFTPEDAIGMLLTISNGDKLSVQEPWNMEIYYRAQKWTLPVQIMPDNTPKKLYAYYPYYKGMERDYTIPVSLAKGNHYLYGSSEELTQSNAEAHIIMRHALTRVTFSVTKAKESDADEYVTRARLYNNNSKAISLEGRMNVFTGEITSNYYTDGIFKDCEFKPEAEKVNVIEMLVIPTQFAESEVAFEVQMGGHVIYATLPAATWERGKHYDYPFEITLNGLKLGNVTVEEWENNNGGSININQ